ncbi:MAG: hypothetical protein ABJM06_04940 [Gilvibacter sp.]
MRFILLFMLIITYSGFAQNEDCACCSTNHTAFDFWIGEWTVTNPNGSYAGSNVIDKIQDNCILRENWTSATPGYTGTSTNYYNSAKKQWIQLWVDNQGQSLYLYGNLKDGAMVLQSDPTSGQNGLTINRVSWTPNSDGTVRQHWETSTDDGVTWATAFDGLYTPKK